MINTRRRALLLLGGAVLVVGGMAAWAMHLGLRGKDQIPPKRPAEAPGGPASREVQCLVNFYLAIDMFSSNHALGCTPFDLAELCECGLLGPGRVWRQPFSRNAPPTACHEIRALNGTDYEYFGKGLPLDRGQRTPLMATGPKPAEARSPGRNILFADGSVRGGPTASNALPMIQTEHTRWIDQLRAPVDAGLPAGDLAQAEVEIQNYELELGSWEAFGTGRFREKEAVDDAGKVVEMSPHARRIFRDILALAETVPLASGGRRLWEESSTPGPAMPKLDTQVPSTTGAGYKFKYGARRFAFISVALDPRASAAFRYKVYQLLLECGFVPAGTYPAPADGAK